MHIRGVEDKGRALLTFTLGRPHNPEADYCRQWFSGCICGVEVFHGVCTCSRNGVPFVMSSSYRCACKVMMHMTRLYSVLFDFAKGTHIRAGQEMNDGHTLPHSAGLQQCLRSSRHGGVALLTSVVCGATHIHGRVRTGVCAHHSVLDSMPWDR